MSPAPIDVSRLPTYAFRHRALVWWGTVSLIVIEGMMFALLIAAYLYLKGRAPQWPPAHPPPDLLWGTLNMAVLLLSAVPNQLAKGAAERLDVYGLRLWLGIGIVFAVVFNAVRVFEFASFNVFWYSDAYGSAVWTLLGFHTFHLVTDLVDSTALWMLFVTGPVKESHFADAADNAMYWYFVVGSWIPIYVVIYLVPRWA